MNTAFSKIFVLWLQGTQIFSSPMWAVRIVPLTVAQWIPSPRLFLYETAPYLCTEDWYPIKHLRGPLRRFMLCTASFPPEPSSSKQNHFGLPQLQSLLLQLSEAKGSIWDPPPCTEIWKLPPRRKAGPPKGSHLIRSPSVRDYGSALPTVQYLKIVVSCILFSFLGGYGTWVNSECTASWSKTQVMTPDNDFTVNVLKDTTSKHTHTPLSITLSHLYFYHGIDHFVIVICSLAFSTFHNRIKSYEGRILSILSFLYPRY